MIDEKIEELKRLRVDEETSKMLDDIEFEVATTYPLSDLIREGSKVTTQAVGWGNGETACALTAAVMAARSHDLI